MISSRLQQPKQETRYVLIALKDSIGLMQSSEIAQSKPLVQLCELSSMVLTQGKSRRQAVSQGCNRKEYKVCRSPNPPLQRGAALLFFATRLSIFV